MPIRYTFCWNVTLWHAAKSQQELRMSKVRQKRMEGDFQKAPRRNRSKQKHLNRPGQRRVSVPRSKDGVLSESLPATRNFYNMFFVSLAKWLTGLIPRLIVDMFFFFFSRPLNELAPYITGTHNLEGKKKKKKNSQAWCQSSHHPAFWETFVCLAVWMQAWVLVNVPEV